MQSPQAKLKEITRLLGSWPTAAAPADGEEQLRAYMLAVEDYPAADVETAVTTLIKGTAPGVNPSFLPVPAVVGSESRRQMNLRLDSEERTRKFNTPALPGPTLIEHTADERARVKAKIDGFLANMAEKMQTPEAEADARRKSELWARTNARFMPDMDSYAVSKRLGFSIGDRDGEEAA